MIFVDTYALIAPWLLTIIFNRLALIAFWSERRKKVGSIIQDAEMAEIITEAFSRTLKRAALETFGGVYDERQLAAMVSQENIEERVLQLISSEYRGG